MSIKYIISSLLVLASVISFTSCEEADPHKSQKQLLDELESGYMRDINELGIVDLHEEMKWRIYCNHCDVAVSDCKDMNLSKATYGMLGLKVFHVSYDYDTDTGEVAYTFIYRDSIQCMISGLPQNSVHGFGFTRNGDKPLYFISSGYTGKISTFCDTFENIDECPTRMINPDQPAIRKFLKRKRSLLNPWFHMQAVRRGFLKDD